MLGDRAPSSPGTLDPSSRSVAGQITAKTGHFRWSRAERGRCFPRHVRGAPLPDRPDRARVRRPRRGAQDRARSRPSVRSTLLTLGMLGVLGGALWLRRDLVGESLTRIGSLPAKLAPRRAGRHRRDGVRSRRDGRLGRHRVWHRTVRSPPIRSRWRRATPSSSAVARSAPAPRSACCTLGDQERRHRHLPRRHRRRPALVTGAWHSPCSGRRRPRRGRQHRTRPGDRRHRADRRLASMLWVASPPRPGGGRRPPGRAGDRPRRPPRPEPLRHDPPSSR